MASENCPVHGTAGRRLAGAWILYDGGRYELAAQECRAALAGNPDSSEAHGLLALCLRRLSSPEEALASARECIRLDPAAAWPHYVLGCVHRGGGRYGDADVALREAIRIDPGRVQYREQLGWTLIDADLNRAALDVAREARRMNPERANPVAIEGLALEALGRVDEAEAALRDALRLDPEHDIAHAAMGYVALRRRRGAEAAKAFQSALKITPGYGWAERGLAESLRHRVPGYGRMERVEAWLNRRSETQRSLLLVGSGVGLFALMISAPFTARAGVGVATLLTIVLAGLFMTLPFAWAFAFWALRPLAELLLWVHPVGKWLVRKERLRRAWILGSMLVGGTTLALVGAFVSWTYGVIAGMNTLLAIPGVAAQFRVPPHQKWGGEQFYLWSAVALGVLPMRVGDVHMFAMLGYVLLWFQVYYCGYLSIAKR